MSKESNILMEKYRTVLARNKDLEEQLSQKQKQWDKRDERFAIQEKNTRELCEKILKTNPDECNLGKEKSWRATDLNTLLKRTNAAFAKYRESKNDSIRNLLDENEKRSSQISSLNDQISRMLQDGGVSMTREQLEKEVKKEKQESEYNKSMPPDQKASVTPITHISEDETDDFSPIEADMMEDMAALDEQSKINKASISYKGNAKERQKKKEMRAAAKNEVFVQDLDKIKGGINQAGWKVIEVIGSMGISVYSDIQAAIINQYGDMFKPASIRSAATTISASGILIKEQVTNPFKRQISVFSLSVLGKKIYFDRFGKEACESESEIIAREHSNLTHGYGIRYFADAIKDTGVFEEVIIETRRHPIQVGNGMEYVPDIICTDKNEKRLFIEYECGNTAQNAFNSKCSRMCMATNVLNIVGPNKDAVEKLKTQVEKWIDHRHADSLVGVTIRVAPATQCAEGNIIQDSAWKYVFEPAKYKNTAHCNY